MYCQTICISELCIKCYSEPGPVARELIIYEMGLPMTARLIEATELRLKTQYLNGKHYLDELELFFPGMLGRTIAAFHRATFDGSKCWCHSDNNPKNIILDWNLTAYYLLDFEDIVFDYPEHDLTHLMLFWVQHFNESDVMRYKNLFLEAYTLLMPIDPVRWNESIPQSIEKFNQRRIQHGKDPSLLLENVGYIQNLLGIDG